MSVHTQSFAHHLRVALVSRLTGDPTFMGYLNNQSTRVRYRPVQAELKAPMVTFGEQVQRPDPTVPLLDILMQIDAWVSARVGNGLDEADKIILRAIQLVDFEESRAAELTPFAVPDEVGRIDYCQWQSGTDQAAEEGDLISVSAVFRLLAYSYPPA